jgi:hypothetical protein
MLEIWLCQSEHILLKEVMKFARAAILVVSAFMRTSVSGPTSSKNLACKNFVPSMNVLLSIMGKVNKQLDFGSIILSASVKENS